ncbi:hypothetical protein FRC07_013242 [Ceratobasidium sp. 392]|nr:hypothetical protein FRC07_013242 [Ceratobasidium sp. 392]
MSTSPAAEHKEKGNASFKAGDYPEAIGHYTAAILADETDPTFPLNRAAAYLKLNKSQDAERDCSTVLKLQPANVKAMFRRAQARVGLGKLTDARADLLAAAKAEPGNAAVRAEFTKVEELIAEAAKKAKDTKGKAISIPSGPPNQASKAPYRRRVPITIKDDDEPESSKKPEVKAVDSAIKTPPPKGILKGGPSTPIASTNPTPSKPLEPPSSTSVKPNDLLTAVSTRAISPASPQGGSSVPTPGQAPAPVGKAPVAVPSTSVEPIISTTSSEAPTQVPAPATRPTPAATTTPVQTPSSPPAPLALVSPNTPPPTLITFLQKWTNANSDEEHARILFTVPPDAIPLLFGPTLESPLLGAMLAALSWVVASFDSEPVRERAADYMRVLARVPRFITLVMFLDGKEKKCATQIWDAVGSTGEERKRWGC